MSYHLFNRIEMLPFIAGMTATTYDGLKGGDVRSQIAIMLLGAIIILSLIEALLNKNFGTIEIIKSGALVILGYFFGKKEIEIEKLRGK